MFTALHSVIPCLLIVGSIWLLLQELRIFRRATAKPWTRLIRRGLGAAVLCLIAFMMYQGDITLILMDRQEAQELARTDSQYVRDCLNYWVKVILLVLIAVVLALWDVIASLKNIRHLLQDSTNDDIKAFSSALAKSKAIDRNEAALVVDALSRAVNASGNDVGKAKTAKAKTRKQKP